MVRTIGQPAQQEHDTFVPHRDDHYLIMLLTQGQVRLHIDFVEEKLNGPGLLLVFPGQVHHLLSARGAEGWLLGFEPSRVERSLADALDTTYGGPLVLADGCTFYNQAITLLPLLEQMITTQKNVYHHQAIRALLSAFLNALAGDMIDGEINTKRRMDRSTIIEQAFKRLLTIHVKTWKQPAQYAGELSVSVAHLNDVVKSNSGVSPSVHIQLRSMLEAKRLLFFTELSVKEIGYAVGYEEPVYFGKLFKKVVGLTPLAFRQKFRD